MSKGQVVFPTSAAPEITILSVGGDLRLTGWELNQVQAEAGNSEDLTAEQAPKGVRLTCRSDANVSVPRQARVMVQTVKGDVKAKALGGALDIQSVGCCLTLRHTGAVSAAQVNGDVDAKGVGGALKLGSVAGSVNVRGVSGEMEVDVRGDLDVNLASRAIRARAGGDIDLRHSLAPGAEYVLEAHGDIHLRAEPGLWARFEMQAGGEVIARVPEAHVEGNAKYRVVTLGQNKAGGAAPAHVMARAGGDVILAESAATDEMDDLGEDISTLADEYAAQIETQVHSHMAELERQLGERLATLNMPTGTGAVDGAAVAARVRQAAERVSDRARRKAEAAQRKLGRQTARSRQDWNGRFEMPSRGPGAAPAKPAAEPVSEAERLAILRMLAEGKISVDEAEKLLAALEGRA
jgi:hypothetical protein